MAAGLEDMSAHFPLWWRPWFRDGSTCIMVRLGRDVQSRTDYILGTDRSLFRNVAVRDPQHNLYHYLVLGCLRSAPLRDHTEYLRRRTRLPLRLLTTPTRKDGLFAALRREISKHKAREARKNVWILEDMWMLVNEKVSTRRYPARDHAHIWRLGRAINMILREDRRRRT